MNLEILPLAITMMAGPQIMSSIIFVTHPRPLSVSAAFLAGVTIATSVGVLIAMGIANLLGDQVDLGGSSESGSIGTIIQLALVAFLVVAAVKNYLGRKTVEPPKWLGEASECGRQEGIPDGPAVDTADAIGHRDHADGWREPGAQQLVVGRRASVHRSHCVGCCFSSDYLHSVSKAGTEGHATCARLDERQQLAGEHHRLWNLHRSTPQ
jgi:hypothetical protein